MTTLVLQRSNVDCVLASLAMAVGKTWDELWDDKILEDMHRLRNRPNDEDLFVKAGLYRPRDYKTLYLHGRYDSESVQTLLSWRRALISIHSLNEPDCNHLIYWDGERVWDPQEGKPGKMWVKQLRGCCISTVHVLR